MKTIKLISHRPILEDDGKDELRTRAYVVELLKSNRDLILSSFVDDDYLMVDLETMELIGSKWFAGRYSQLKTIFSK